VVESDPRQFSFIVDRLKGVGTQFQTGIESNFGPEINFDNLLAQVRVGCQPYWGRFENYIKDNIHKMSEEELNRADAAWQTECALRRLAFEEQKSAKVTAAASQDSSSAVAGSESQGGADAVQPSDHVDRHVEINPYLEKPLVLKQFECSICQSLFDSVLSCVGCKGFVCDYCSVSDYYTGSIFCTGICHERYASESGAGPVHVAGGVSAPGDDSQKPVADA
jgi:hypothetical protein